ncbi:SGNH/GDSL hydrolase family protein [Phascolarctobacterium sp.]|uniref:SGNH/GDSL hydrolase family protein n=1 Tax=Phascolarctobacterium sp. TaxID=2049039 RepID=UPI0038667C50
MQYIACYGDSLIQGFPYGTRYSWTAAVEQAAPLKMLNYGLCGDCCDDILYRMRQYALPEYVKHILFLGGANDMLQGRSLEAVLYDYKRLLDWCTEKGYALCIVLPLISAEDGLNTRLLTLRQQVEELYADKALLLDLQPAIGMDAATRKAAYLDGVHPKSATYTAMGQYAAPILQKWVEGR